MSDETSPALEVGFVIDTGGAFQTLQTLDDMIGSTAADAVRQFQKIESATKGLDLGGASAGITAFAATTSAAFNKAEQAAERMTFRLKEQAETFGMTRAAAAAWRAEQVGATSAAEALLTAESALNALRQGERQTLTAAAQAYDMFESAARRGAEAMREADAAAKSRELEAQAQALRSATQGYDMFEAAARRGAAAMREADAAARSEALEAQAQALRSATQGYDMFEAAARRASAAANDVAKAEAQMAGEASALRASIDPMFLAQQRFDAELARADQLLAAGAIGQREYDQATQHARDTLYSHAKAVAGTSEVLREGAHELDGHSTALGLNRMQFVIGASAAHRFVDSIMAGTSPMRAFMMQAGDVATVLQMDDGGVAGGLAKVRALITPVSVGIAALAGTVLLGTLAWLEYSNATEKAQALSMGAGRVIGISADEIAAQASAAANLAMISTGAARQIISGYVEMGGIGKSVLGGLTALSVDFAAATGKDSKAAVEELGRAFQDPAKGADELAQRYGALSQAQVEHIKSLVEANDLYGAQRALLKGLEPAFDGASDHANGLAMAWHFIATQAANAWDWMGKTIDRAAGGGTLLQRISDLQAKRGWLQGISDPAVVGAIDKQIAALQRELQVVNNAGARSKAVTGMKLVDSIVGEDDVGNLRTRLNTVKGLLADNGKAAGLTAEQVGNARQAYDMLTHAVGTYLPEAEKQVKVAQLDAQIAAAKKGHNQGAAAALTAQRSQIENSGKLMTAAQAEAQATAAGAKAKVEATGAADKHAAALVREAAAVNAQIKNSYKLVDAYGVSGAAALIAEARVKAESQAIKQRGDIEAAVARQVALAVAQRVVEAAKGAAAANDQAKIQEQVNSEVAAGNVPAALANELVRARIADLPLLAALEAAQKMKLVKGTNEATAALDAQRAARDRDTASKRESAVLDVLASGKDQLAMLREEAILIGATDSARVHALATLKATQDEVARGGVAKDGLAAQQIAIADAQQDLAAKQRDYNDALTFTADKWDLIARNVQAAGQGMADAFGGAGKAIGDMASIYAGYQANRHRLDAQHAADLLKADKSQSAMDRANVKFALASSTQQIGAYGDMAAAAKGFFNEKSAGYKAIQAAEQVFRAFEFAMSVRSMVQNALETAGVVTNAAVKATAEGTAGIAKQSQLPFPFNIAAMAATGAALIAAGVAVFGDGGSAHVTDPGNTGTGTVLGDSSAKSDSIKNALDALKDVDTLTNTYAREMSASLKSIDNQIGGVAAQIVKGGADATGASVAEGFKPNAIGSVLGAIPLIGGFLSSLFGSKTEVTASGLYGGSQSLGSVLNGGYNAQTYSDVTKTSKFLGITTGHSYSTQYGALDSGLQNQFTLILKSFDDAIVKAAGPLGAATTEIQDRLNGFVVNLGKIDLKGLTGTEIQAKLTAVFGAAADSMADAAFPGIARFQKVGEGAFETLVRVASTVEAVTNALSLLGGATASLGMDAKIRLADQFDSVSDLISATDAYFQAFYTSAEQTAAKTAQMGKVFDSLGLSMPASLAAFRQLVEAQDLATDAGRSTYATLLQLAPAFSDLQTSMEGVKSAADVLSEKQDLQRQLLELQGNTAAIRALDLAKVDASNRELQQQVWAIQDAQDAAKAAKDLSDAWTSVGDSITTEINRIRGLSSTGGSSDFATLMGQFNAATSAARGGDMDAAKTLPGLSQSLLSAAALVASSRQELARVQAQTASSLEATNAALGGRMTSSAADNASILAAAATTSQANAAPAASNDDMASEIKALREEMAGMRSDANAGNAAIASGVGRIARKLDDVTSESGGTAVSVASAA